MCFMCVSSVGVYACTVQETMKGQTVMENITVTVLGEYTHTHTCANVRVCTHTHTLMCVSLSADQGYVYLWPSGETNVSSLLHHTVEFSIEVDAHPAPTVRWTRENQTVDKDTTSVTTTHLTGSR